ncbi:response regulator transcription factor [uncultured Polaribacter sp.]|uniref:response regulator transcription factor n=1 Tax=uncultured Polaribacter sp. TaxID=174711 RepID=UPI00261D87E7|nr:response regulator transcription factor [uncultured Polaribacter sp.]
MTLKKRVIIIEDEMAIREAYKYYFKSFDNYYLVADYECVEDALEEFKETDPDIVLSDISLPGLSGIEGVKRYKNLKPEVKILILSIHDDLTHIIDSLKSLVDGYITKPVKQQNLLNSLESLQQGGAPLSNDVSRKLIEFFHEKKIELFSERENEVVNLLMKGNSYKTIADQLFISTSTVNYHIQNIYTKLNVSSKPEALKELKKLLNK